MPEAPINIMDQYRPENFCDSRSPTYRPQYAELPRRPTAEELRKTYHRAQALGLRFGTLTFEKGALNFSPVALSW